MTQPVPIHGPAERKASENPLKERGLAKEKSRHFFSKWCKSGGEEIYEIEDVIWADTATFEDIARDINWSVDQAAFLLRGWRMERVADYSKCLEYLRRVPQFDAECDALIRVSDRLQQKFKCRDQSLADADGLAPSVEAKAILAWAMSPPFPACDGKAEVQYPPSGLIEAVTGEKDSYQELKSKFEQATTEIEKIKSSTARQTVGKSNRILKFLVLLAQRLYGFEKPGDAAKAYEKMHNLLLPNLKDGDEVPSKTVFESWLAEGGKLMGVPIRRHKSKSGFKPGSDS